MKRNDIDNLDKIIRYIVKHKSNFNIDELRLIWDTLDNSREAAIAITVIYLMRKKKNRKQIVKLYREMRGV